MMAVGGMKEERWFGFGFGFGLGFGFGFGLGLGLGLGFGIRSWSGIGSRGPEVYP